MKTIFNEYNFSVPKVSSSININQQKDKAFIQLLDSFSQNISDVFCKIDYLGGSCTASIHSKPVSDNLFNGTSWMLGLKRYLGKGQLDLQIKDWNNTITGVPENVVKEIKAHEASFKKIQVMSQYKIMLQTTQ